MKKSCCILALLSLVLIVRIGWCQNFQGAVPVEVEVLEQASTVFGLKIAELFGLALIIIAAVNAVLKSALKMKGRVLATSAIVLSFGVALAKFAPQWGQVVGAGLVLSIAAVGGWESFKRLAHKVGK